jgi:hypothetical protein
VIQFTAREMNGGNGHEHVARLWWTDTSTGTDGLMDIDTVTRWLDKPENRAFVEDRVRPGNYVEAFVVKPIGNQWYIRTAADGRWTDNILALPERRLRAA